MDTFIGFDVAEDELEAAYEEIRRLRAVIVDLKALLAIARGNNATIKHLRAEIEELKGRQSH